MNMHTYIIWYECMGLHMRTFTIVAVRTYICTHCFTIVAVRTSICTHLTYTFKHDQVPMLMQVLIVHPCSCSYRC
jgi:hypothetical protein